MKTFLGRVLCAPEGYGVGGDRAVLASQVEHMTAPLRSARGPSRCDGVGPGQIAYFK